MYNSKHARKHQPTVRQRKRIDSPPPPKAFEEFAFVMDAAQQMIWARQFPQDNVGNFRRAEAWSSFFHNSLAQTDDRVLFAKRCRQASLTQVEVEIVAALLLSHFSMMASDDPKSRGELFEMLGVTRHSG